MKQLQIIFHGDYGRCQMAMGNAKRVLTKLYQTLGAEDGLIQQGWQPATPLFTGEVVQCHIGLGFDTIHIYAEVGGEQADIEVAKEVIRECPCNCNMSVGTILSRTLSRTPGTPYFDIGLVEAPFYIYTVEICQNNDGYILFENIIGSDFTPWEEGQQVIVMAYHDFLFGCCLPDPGILGDNFAQFTASGCSGIIDTGHYKYPAHLDQGMDMNNHGWRTTFRILQMCALPIPLWEEKN